MRTFQFPLRYKLVGLTLLILFSGMVALSLLLRNVLIEDKKLFIMDLNLAVLDASASALHGALNRRLEGIKEVTTHMEEAKANPHAPPATSATPELANELLGLSIYELSAAGKLEKTDGFINTDLLQLKNIPKDEVTKLGAELPNVPLTFPSGHPLELVNRSARHLAGFPNGLAILTLVLPAKFVGKETGKAIVVADLLQDFVTTALRKSDLAELFLLSSDGTLLAHSQPAMTIQYAGVPFPHPIRQKIVSPYVRKGSAELTFEGESYLVNMAELGLSGASLVSQVKSEIAFQSVHAIEYKTAVILLVIAYVLSIICFIFSKRISSNAEKLKVATEALGAGDFDSPLEIHSRDEIEQVANSFIWMRERLKDLMSETASKARMENELKTASLVQSMLIRPAELPEDVVSVDSHYVPASEIGGDFWDAYQKGNLITVLIGDATGHGAAGAIVMAVAKSCFASLNNSQTDFLRADELLRRMNKVLYQCCQGKLLMTMFILQIDLTSGKALFANAGHEAPLMVRAKTPTEEGKTEVEALFSRGERLGFSPDSEYVSTKTKLELNDTVLLYTDGVSEIKNKDGKAWGERALKKVFLSQATEPVSKIRANLASSIESYAGSVALEDDVTFVILRWEHPLDPAKILKVA
jgi:serine phosphatase RsbU (regulator of sigma subunit)